jgi:hypothetical protein
VNFPGVEWQYMEYNLRYPIESKKRSKDSKLARFAKRAPSIGMGIVLTLAVIEIYGSLIPRMAWERYYRNFNQFRPNISGIQTDSTYEPIIPKFVPPKFKTTPKMNMMDFPFLEDQNTD